MVPGFLFLFFPAIRLPSGLYLSLLLLESTSETFLSTFSNLKILKKNFKKGILMLKMSPSYLTYLRMQKKKTLILICKLGLDIHASLSAYAVLFKSIVNNGITLYALPLNHLVLCGIVGNHIWVDVCWFKVLNEVTNLQKEK